MFTGIVEGVGTVKRVSKSPGRRSAVTMVVDLGSNAEGLGVGQSVALNGVCLTAVGLDGSRCTFEMIDETARLTDLGSLKEGSVVNVERSLRAGDRLEGHFVLGHVDGVGVIRRMHRKEGEVQVWVEMPADLARQVVKKGSIAVDGISLTVAGIEGNVALVCLIPHTVDVTSMDSKKEGDRVNIETDILGKYVVAKK